MVCEYNSEYSSVYFAALFCCMITWISSIIFNVTYSQVKMHRIAVCHFRCDYFIHTDWQNDTSQPCFKNQFVMYQKIQPDQTSFMLHMYMNMILVLYILWDIIFMYYIFSQYVRFFLKPFVLFKCSLILSSINGRDVRGQQTLCCLLLITDPLSPQTQDCIAAVLFIYREKGENIRHYWCWFLFMLFTKRKYKYAFPPWSYKALTIVFFPLNFFHILSLVASVALVPTRYFWILIFLCGMPPLL